MRLGLFRVRLLLLRVRLRLWCLWFGSVRCAIRLRRCCASLVLAVLLWLRLVRRRRSPLLDWAGLVSFPVLCGGDLGVTVIDGWVGEFGYGRVGARCGIVVIW